MRRRHWLALVTFGICLSFGQARADEILAPHHLQGEVAPQSNLLARTWQAITNVSHSHGVGCYAHHNGEIGCSSLRSELRFIFSSCRVWWGEPCQLRPPDMGEPNTVRPGCNAPYVQPTYYTGRGYYTGQSGCNSPSCR